MSPLPLNRVITPEDVQERIEQIRAVARDDETAHSNEDELHQGVLRAIAEGRAEDARLCAFIALSTREIEFCRRCA